MCSSRPKTPPMPEMPPPRAMENLPSRGTVAPEARRQVQSTLGAPGRPGTDTVMGGAARSTTGDNASAPSTAADPIAVRDASRALTQTPNAGRSPRAPAAAPAQLPIGQGGQRTTVQTNSESGLGNQRIALPRENPSNRILAMVMPGLFTMQSRR